MRGEPNAAASSEAIFERSKLGIAIETVITMIAATINSSSRVNWFCLPGINATFSG